MLQTEYDVVVIGAGVSGCAVARELSRFKADVLVLEAEADVCCGTSKANSAIVHAGFDAETGSLMAKLNVEGNKLMYQLADELDFACLPIGSLVVCTSEEGRDGLEVLLERGVANGVEGLEILERDALVAMEPNVSDDAVCALWAPTGGIVDPFGLTIALAENAADNGVEFAFEEPVTGLEALAGGGFEVTTPSVALKAKVVVNAAGVYADEIHNMVCPDKIEIVARKGEYYLLDTTAGTHVSHTVFMLPGPMGKGVLVSPTVHGNLIVGPTATDVDDKEATDTTPEGLAELAAKCTMAVKDVPLREVITSFSGLRAHQAAHDFIIGEHPEVPGFVDCAAIESPGLTSAPAIGVMIKDIVSNILQLEAKDEAEVQVYRKGIVNLNIISYDDWQALINGDSAYGRIVCRCCRVSEAQIADSVTRTLGARNLDGVKRRTGAMMGRCQGGFCSPKVMEIIARDCPDIEFSEITKCGAGSGLIVGRDKHLKGGDAV